MNTETNRPLADAFVLRGLRREDAPLMHRLVRECPPLDLNSSYAYVLLATHHASTCIVAEESGRLVGMVTGYLLPDSPDTLFIWQVAVHESARGQRLAARMIQALLDRPACRSASKFQTTITADNTASRRVFESVALRLGSELQQIDRIDAGLLGDGDHPDEIVYQAGPFRNETKPKEREHGDL